MRGADILAQMLAEDGQSILFSLSGNQIMPVYDAALDARLRIIHTRHEGAAGFMARLCPNQRKGGGCLGHSRIRPWQ